MPVSRIECLEEAVKRLLGRASRDVEDEFLTIKTSVDGLLCIVEIDGSEAHLVSICEDNKHALKTAEEIDSILDKIKMESYDA